MIDTPGLFEIDATTYHADPCPAPSLNNSLISDLLECPKLAWYGHPRLNPAWAEDAGMRKMDLGSVAHKLLLGAGRDLAVIDAADYRTKDAREARDAAREAGKIPVLPDQLAQAQDMCSAVARQLSEFEGAPLSFHSESAQREVGLFWLDMVGLGNSAGVWCRNLIDTLVTDAPTWEVWDYKTSGANINPESAGLGVHVVDMGYDTQCAFQERGLTTLYPQLAGRIKFRLLFQSTDEPYLISVVEPDAATMTMARKKVDYAIGRWSACLASGQWPAYPQRIMPLRHAEFLAARWLEREVREFDAGELPSPPPPVLKRKRGRPFKPKKSETLTDLSGG